MDDTAKASETAAAPDIETIDVTPVNKRGNRSLYAARPRIHPKRARGGFRRLKWIIMAVTLAIYYLTPWIRWDRGPGAPDQAVLIDFPARRFYFFFIEIWPQEVYYITGLLILAAVGLFLFTALFGRVWCGYACPQTVWTDLFLVIERAIEGDRNARIRLDRAPWNARKISLKAVKHAIWLVIGLLTGGAWVFYFADAPMLAGEIVRFEAPLVAYVFIGIFTATTYLLGGLAREQVCTYMCPWPRIQSAMLDEESLVVSYHPERGEPRAPYRKDDSWSERGHCVACNQCVAVCPMGIDIRDGQQLECITCALCIDACDEVMDRFSLPRGLISYDTLANTEQASPAERTRFRLIRPRTIVYTAILGVVGAVMLYAFTTRSNLDVNVLHDRNPLFVRLADGSIRNGYTVKVLNKLRQVRFVRISLAGLSGATLHVIGSPEGEEDLLAVPQDAVKSFRVFVTVPVTAVSAGPRDFTFVMTDTDNKLVIRHDAAIRGPAK